VNAFAVNRGCIFVFEIYFGIHLAPLGRNWPVADLSHCGCTSKLHVFLGKPQEPFCIAFLYQSLLIASRVSIKQNIKNCTSITPSPSLLCLCALISLRNAFGAIICIHCNLVLVPSGCYIIGKCRQALFSVSPREVGLC
jgi:hypothetical protein